VLALVELARLFTRVCRGLSTIAALPGEFLNRFVYHVRPDWIHSDLFFEGRRTAPPRCKPARLAITVSGALHFVVKLISFTSQSIISPYPENKEGSGHDQNNNNQNLRTHLSNSFYAFRGAGFNHWRTHTSPQGFGSLWKQVFAG